LDYDPWKLPLSGGTIACGCNGGLQTKPSEFLQFTGCSTEAGIAPGKPGAQKASAGFDVLFAVREIEQARKKQLGIAADLQSGDPSEQPDELRIGSFDAVFLHAQAVHS
jgi:hypothetical protein